MAKDLLAQVAIAQVPQLLTLMDRNPHSPTYGCCDRNFWHYKIIDFPSGMAQEFVWPLALAYDTDIANNPFYQQAAIRDWVEAGVLYAAQSAHGDGSCDDYFPYERASGAAAFSLLACMESYQLLELDNYNALRFFEQRANWLAHHHESGQLSNHQTLIALCLERAGQLLKSSQWDRAKALRLERVLSWQHEEGWFREYEGCDPGYQTLTIGCLAQLEQVKTDSRLQDAIAQAVKLVSHFIHPDGSFGGEYTSRNTYNFFPHSFEIAGCWLPEALAINDRFLQGLERWLAPCYSDDHIVGHHTWSYLLAWRCFVAERPPLLAREPGRIWLPGAQLLVDRRPMGAKSIATTESDPPAVSDTAPEQPAELVELYLATGKGGVFKLFRGNRLIASDTQFSVQVRAGRKVKNAVGHLVDRYQVDLQVDEIAIQGTLGWAKQTQMTPLKLMVLRAVMLSLGRFFPNLIRSLLQKILITGKQSAPFTFQRRLTWRSGQWVISDELKADSWERAIAVGIGCAQTSIYVVMSRTFQRGQLQPWLDLTERVRKLKSGQPLTVERRLP